VPAQKPRRKIRVGITASHASDVPSVLWSNGIFQNIVYLALLFQKNPDVEVSLVSYPFGDKSHPIGECFKIPVIGDAAEAKKLDIIIELGIRLERDFTEPFRKRGGKLVSYMAGNALVMNFESVFLPADVAGRGSVVSPDGFDAVWITPQHWHMNAGVARMNAGPPEVAPHIWAPTCIEHAIASLGLNPAWKGRPKTWSLATFDPNINVVKSFHIPLLVAEAAHRRQPATIRRMMLFCAEHLKGRPHFESYVTETSLAKAAKVTAEARHGVVSMLGREVDCVITHQWENDLNYLYWDVLYLGYPLIHNSKRIASAGYYYDDFQPLQGGGALLDAINNHDGPREEDQAAVWDVHIGNETNQEKYRLLLEKVLDAPKASV
jgi:hypothetical protein